MSVGCGTNAGSSPDQYDHERVLTFDVQDTRAVLSAVANSFTETPEALQKSALVELGAGGGELVIVDRSKRAGITTFFQDFLGARRKHSETEMTSNLSKAMLKVVRIHCNDLPLDITSRVKERLVDIAERRPDFEAGRFFEAFFGAYGSDAVRATYEELLDRVQLRGESFPYDHSSLPRSGPRRYTTNEGVRLIVPEGATDTVTIEESGVGTTVVSIRTRSLTEQ
jgi:hypothetical protein